MQQRRRRLAILFGASVMAGLITLVACGETTQVVPLPGGGSSTTSSSGSNGSNGGTDDDDATDDDTTDDDDSADGAAMDAAGADCSAAPKLRKTDKGFFCAFYRGDAAADAGGTGNCPHETVCCNTNKKVDDTNFFPTFCAPNANPGNGVKSCTDSDQDFDSEFEPGTAWECASAANCPNSLKCCVTSQDGADAGNYVNVGFIPSTEQGAPPKACGAKKLFKFKSTRCAASCVDKKEIELCSETDECTGGKTCVPVRANRTSTANNTYRELGACQ